LPSAALGRRTTHPIYTSRVKGDLIVGLFGWRVLCTIVADMLTSMHCASAWMGSAEKDGYSTAPQRPSWRRVSREPSCPRRMTICVTHSSFGHHLSQMKPYYSKFSKLLYLILRYLKRSSYAIQQPNSRSHERGFLSYGTMIQYC